MISRIDSIRATQRDTAALLAIEAFRAADTPATRSALLATFTDGQPPYDTHRYDNERSPTRHRDARRRWPRSRATTDWSATSISTPGSEATPCRPPETASDPRCLRSSPDGRLLAQIAEPEAVSDPVSTIAVYDLSTRQLRFEPIVIDDWVESATFSADGTLLLLDLTSDGRVIAIDSADGHVASELAGVDDPYPAGGGLATVGDASVVAGSAGGLVRILDAETLQVIASLTVPPGTTTSLLAVG